MTKKYDSRSKKYESPYGRKEAMKKDKPQLRGCGDPNCMMCNPETAGQGLSSPIRRYSSAQSGTFFVTSTSERQYLGAIADTPEPQYSERLSERISRELEEAREGVKDYIVKTDHILDWGDVVGNHEAKEALVEAVESSIKDAALYKFYNMKQSKGVLLMGPPGCGKTMFAKAASAKIRSMLGKTEMISLSSSRVQSPWVGETEARIRAVFDYANLYKKHYKVPLVIFVDECEIMFPNRQSRPTATWENSQVATFLECLDGVDESGAFVILATNLPDRLDAALLRDGRIDRKIKVNRPTEMDSYEIFSRAMKGVPCESVEALTHVAMESFWKPHLLYDITGYHVSGHTVNVDILLRDIVSGALITGLVNKAKSVAFNRDKKAGTMTGVTPPDVMEAIEMTIRDNQNIRDSYAIYEVLERHSLQEKKKGMN